MPTATARVRATGTTTATAGCHRDATDHPTVAVAPDPALAEEDAVIARLRR